MKTEEKIVTAFCQLLPTKKPENITIRDVAQQAKLSLSTVYNYTSKKSNLSPMVLDFVFDQLTTILTQNLLYRRPVMFELLSTLVKYQDIYYPLVTCYPNIDVICKDYISDMIIHSEIPNVHSQLATAYQLPKSFAFEVYILTIQGIIFAWIKNGFQESIDSVTDMIYASVAI